MPMTKAQYAEIYFHLDSEVAKARKAVDKAAKALDEVPYVYGGSVEAEIANVILQMRKAQHEAANNVAKSFFENYIA